MRYLSRRIQIRFNLALQLNTLQSLQAQRPKSAIRTILPVVMAFCFVTGCQSNSTSANAVLNPQQYLASPLDQEVYASLLTQQCQSINPQQDQARIDQLSSYLQQHGIVVKAHSLALDGQMRIQQCGTADGRGVIFRIATQNMEQAKTLGFVAVTANTLRLPQK